MTRIDRLIGEFEQAIRDHQHCQDRHLETLAKQHGLRVRKLKTQLKAAIGLAIKNAPPRYSMVPRAVEDMM